MKWHIIISNNRLICRTETETLIRRQLINLFGKNHSLKVDSRCGTWYALARAGRSELCWCGCSWVARYTACPDQNDPHRRLRSAQTLLRHAAIGSSKKTGKHRPQPSQNSEAPAEALDLSDLDLSSIEFSEREMAALSGLTPALSRRLQRQLLAHLPPRAAARLRRTLSLHAPASPAPPAPSASPRTPYGRCHSAEQALDHRSTDIDVNHSPAVETSTLNVPADESNEPVKPTDETPTTIKFDDIKTESHHTDLPVSQFCTLPRLRRRSTFSGDNESLASTGDVKNESSQKEPLSSELISSKVSGVRCASDRPLLSKYLAPDRNHSLDETYSESGSIVTEPSYIAAYGSSALGNMSGLGFRRHSLRLSGENAKKRVSRFLRSDFFDTPSDESLYAKHKKEKELETQKILREIREKKNKSLDTTKSPTEVTELRSGLKDECSVKKCLSPVGNLLLKDRSRSTTPFFPILDNIKETVLDSSIRPLKSVPQESDELEDKEKIKESSLNKESRMIRPKSYPIKCLETYNDPNKGNASVQSSQTTENIIEDKKVSKESKLMRPKSYPTGSPSPEKVYVNRNNKKDEMNSKDTTDNTECKTDIEVSFNLTLPKKTKPLLKKSDSLKKVEVGDAKGDSKMQNKNDFESTLSIKKYQINDSKINDIKDNKFQCQNNLNETIAKSKKSSLAKDDQISTVVDDQLDDKKEVKKKIIKRISSKSKTDLSDDPKTTVEKKKITKKIKDKSSDDSKTSITKKRSVLQSIGHKLEKFTSSKSSSPEKLTSNGLASELNKESSSSNRTQREQSVPVIIDPATESNLLKRAVTITDVAALENQSNNQNKTTVSKVLGLFKKFEPKEKIIEPIEEKKIDTTGNSFKSQSNSNVNTEEKAKRPTSLLLNGLGRKNKFSRSSSDDNYKETVDIEDQQVKESKKKDTESKNIRNTLKLDFSRLPRVKKIVPTNPVIEPQFFNISDSEKNTDSNHIIEKNGIIIDDKPNVDLNDSQIARSRSRSKSTYSNSDIKSDLGIKEKNVVSDTPIHHINVRNHESITPEKEDIVDRIRRKSFYSRFNEKKQRRKSNLVGPGAIEYDPLARIQSQAAEPKYDGSPTSPGNYDLSPGLSIDSDASPSSDRYKSLLSDLPLSPRSNLRYDGVNDKFDMYRSLDRNDFRKYPGSKGYLDYDQPLSYNSNRYSRTKSLFDSADTTEEDHSFALPRETQKYNRTNTLFSPGSYATYRPKRTRNSAIILKESEKEPSPENILDKIRQRKISISVTRKPGHEKEPTPRSNVSSKGESDGSERSTKID